MLLTPYPYLPVQACFCRDWLLVLHLCLSPETCLWQMTCFIWRGLGVMSPTPKDSLGSATDWWRNRKSPGPWPLGRSHSEVHLTLQSCSWSQTEPPPDKPISTHLFSFLIIPSLPCRSWLRYLLNGHFHRNPYIGSVFKELNLRYWPLTKLAVNRLMRPL